MKLLFWRQDGKSKTTRLDAIEEQAIETHRKNIEEIVKSRETAVKLKTVLKQNNITIELAKAIGH